MVSTSERRNEALIKEVFSTDCGTVNPRGACIGSAALKANYGYILRDKRSRVSG
jgi:hypothetical protein